MTRRMELFPMADNAKSFYGKAFVIQEGDTYTLLSYGLPIIMKRNDKFTLLCEDEDLSNTTIKHLREFMRQFGISNVADYPKKKMVKTLREHRYYA